MTLLRKDPEAPSRICRFLRDELPGAIFLQRMLKLPLPAAENQRQSHVPAPRTAPPSQVGLAGGRGGASPEAVDHRGVRETAGLCLPRHSRLRSQVRDRLVTQPPRSHRDLLCSRTLWHSLVGRVSGSHSNGAGSLCVRECTYPLSLRRGLVSEYQQRCWIPALGACLRVPAVTPFRSCVGMPATIAACGPKGTQFNGSRGN